MALPAILGVAARSVGAAALTGGKIVGKAGYAGLKRGVVASLAAQNNKVVNVGTGAVSAWQASRDRKRQEQQEQSKQPPAEKTKNKQKSEQDEKDNKQRQEKAKEESVRGNEEQTSVLKVISHDTKDILAGIELLVEEGIGGKSEKKGGGLMGALMALVSGAGLFSKGFLPMIAGSLTRMAAGLAASVSRLISGAVGGLLGRAGMAAGALARSAGTVGRGALLAGSALAAGGARAGAATAAKGGVAVGKAAGTVGGLVAKTAGKSLLKKIPVIGAIAGLGFAANRAMAGDWTGAGMEAASGAASLVPGVGTAASLGIDAALLARDYKGGSGGGGSTGKRVTGVVNGRSASQSALAVSPGKPRMEVLLESLMWSVRTMTSNMLSPDKGIYVRNVREEAAFAQAAQEQAKAQQENTPQRRASAETPGGSSLSGMPVHQGLGGLSALYESGKRGSSAVGWDSTGGTSYGKYQIASKTGTMNKFMQYIKDKDPEVFQRLQAAGPQDAGKDGNFAKVWKQLASEGALKDYEHDFIKKTHYDPAMGKLKSDGLKGMIGKSAALQDVMWSTSVQHGDTGGAGIFNKVYRDGMTEEDLINAVYSERGTRFGSSKPKVRANVLNRFQDERRKATAMLSQDNVTKQVRESVAQSSAANRAPIVIPMQAPQQSAPAKSPATSGGGASGAPLIVRSPDHPLMQWSWQLAGTT